MNDLPDEAWSLDKDGMLEFFQGVVEQMQL